MAKKKKISEEQLSTLQQLVKAINETKNTIGSIELEKVKLVSQFDQLEEELNKQRSTLKETYGDINVDLTTGEYEEIKE
jgi:phage regulator Rha-like protein